MWKRRDGGKLGHVCKGGQENGHPSSRILQHPHTSDPHTPCCCTRGFLRCLSQICAYLNAFGNWTRDGIRVRGALSHLSLYQNSKAFWNSILSYLIEMNGKHYTCAGEIKRTQPNVEQLTRQRGYIWPLLEYKKTHKPPKKKNPKTKKQAKKKPEAEKPFHSFVLKSVTSSSQCVIPLICWVLLRPLRECYPLLDTVFREDLHKLESVQNRLKEKGRGWENRSLT